MSVPARVRLVLARSPWLYWVLVAALAATAGVFMLRAAAGVEAARRSWGDERAVLVAARAVAPGQALAAAVQRRQLPSPMVPADALADVPDDAVARQHIAVGEVVVAHDIAPGAPPQSLIPTGWLAVAVAEPVASGARAGDAVTVASGGIVVAADGIVVAAGAEALVVAVPAEHAPLVAQAAAAGDVAVLLQP